MDEQRLRDEFAMAALAGLLSYSYVNPAHGNFIENCSIAQAGITAYAYADAMLLARKQEAS